MKIGVVHGEDDKVAKRFLYLPQDHSGEYKIPNGITHIGDGAFRGCDNLTSIQLPVGVTHIGYSAFFWCKNLGSVSLPASVTHIGNWAFKRCEKLMEIALPVSVKEVGENAFDSAGCEAQVKRDYTHLFK